MRPPKQGIIQAKRAKRAAPTPTASPALPLWSVAALEGLVEAEAADPVAALVLDPAADAGLIVWWSVSHAGGKELEIVVPRGGGSRGWGLCRCRSDGSGGGNCTSSSTGARGPRTRSGGETGSVGFCKLALDLDDRNGSTATHCLPGR